MRPAEAGAVRALGAVPGYASPVGLRSDDLVVVADDLVAESPNLVSGANEEGFHLLNVNFGRDCRADVVADIATAFAGAPCPQCRRPLHLAAAVEIASLHRLEAGFSETLELSYQDQDGSLRPVAMGAYGIGLGRLLACIAEQHHDEHGLRLPASVAPYEVYLVVIGGGNDIVTRQADAVYAAFREAGTEVLYDDRDVSSGVKFNDADLIGIPLRATLGARSLQQGGVELKQRDRHERQIASIDAVVESAARALAELRAELQPQGHPYTPGYVRRLVSPQSPGWTGQESPERQ
jgi:prolyl-tRNA synthetase